MTLPLNSRLSALYDTNGTQRDFGFGFRVFFDPDNGGYGLEVRRQTADGYEVIPKSDYLVLPVEDNSAGIVRFSVAPSAGQQIYIAGKTPTIQQLVLTNFGRYSAESIETQFDFLTAIIQEWISALGEETRQRIANDEIVKEYADEKFLEFQGWVYDQFPNYARSAFDEIFEGFYSQWLDALNELNKENLKAENVFDGNENQHQINNSLIRTYNSVSDLLSIPNPRHGQVAFVRHYDLDQGLLDGGGIFVYQNTNQLTNDGGYIFNGWTRKLERPIFTPEMFGAKGDLSKDDAPNIRSCVLSARTNKIKGVHFYNKYLIDSARIAGQETLLEIIPNCSFLGFGDAELVVGDNIPDKFHILAAVNYIITTPDVGNVLVDGIKFRGLSAASNMSAYTSNLAIHTFGLNNVCIQRCTFDDLDLSNVIAAGIQYNGISYGSKVVVQNNKVLSVVAEHAVNIDHSSFYIEAINSVVRHNLFKSKNLQCRKVACGIEIHNSGILVHDNYLEGYSRFVWFAAQPNNVINSHAYNNTAKVSNHFAIITSALNERVGNCSIHGNYVRCEHATSEPNFVTYQGLAVTSGVLYDGWQYVLGFDIYDNELHIDHSVNADFATIVNFDQDISGMISKNSCYGAVAGVNAKDLTNGGGFVGNKIYNHVEGAAKNKDFFINISNASSNSMSICDNEFWFKPTTKPNYLVGLPNITGNNLISCSISGNKYKTTYKPQADVYFQPSLNIGGNGNTLDINVFNATVNIPALTAEQEHVWTQALPNNFNNCIVDVELLPEGGFYPLVNKGVASGSNLDMRVKAISTSAAFSVSGVNMRIRTR